VIVRLIKGTGLSGAVRYVMGQGYGRGNDWTLGEDSRVAWVSGQGFGFDITTRDDVDLARRVMEFDAGNQRSRTKRCHKDVMHISLSWHPDEQPTPEQMKAAAQEALAALGMEKARAVFVAHKDRAHTHLHIVASRINPDTGRAFADRNDWLKLDRWALAYELREGIIRCPRRTPIDPHDSQKVLELLTSDRSVFTRRDLERLINRSIVSRRAVAKLADNILADAATVPLRETDDSPVSHYTTGAVLEAERALMRDASALVQSSAHRLSERVRDDILDRHSHLDSEQRAALLRASAPQGLTLISGEAGTGKSVTLQAIREAYAEAGYEVRGLAPTNAVVQDMKADGFAEAFTLASEIQRLAKGLTRWNPRTVLIVDEAAMLSTQTLAEILHKARRTGAKVVLAGDDKQLPSIQRGGMYSTLCFRYGAAELHQVRRISDKQQRLAFNRMHAQDFAAALAIFEQQGALHWGKTQKASRDALVAQYIADTVADPTKKRFVFAYTNADVDRLNTEIRAWRRERGELGPNHILPTKDGPVEFAVGDRIQFTGNARRKAARDLGLTNGMVGTLRHIDGLRLTVELDRKVKGQPRLVAFTVGDNDKAGSFNAFKLGYAGTIHKGQGRTLDHSYLLHTSNWRSAASYVALTRHREHTSIFASHDTTKDIAHLARQMARVDDRRAASLFVCGEPATSDTIRPEAVDDLLRQWKEHAPRPEPTPKRGSEGEGSSFNPEYTPQPSQWPTTAFRAIGLRLRRSVWTPVTSHLHPSRPPPSPPSTTRELRDPG
jgi:hypothetical protein